MPQFILHFSKTETVLLNATLIVDAKSAAEARRKGKKIEAEQGDELEHLWTESDVACDGFEFDQVEKG